MTKEQLQKANKLESDIHNTKRRIEDLLELISSPKLETRVWDGRSSSMTYEVIIIDPVPFLQTSLDGMLLKLESLEKEFEQL